MSTNEDLLCQALEIEPPWRIVRMRNDLGRRQLDVWVARHTPRRGWFFGTSAAAPEAPEQVWRHVNVGQARCLIHASPTDDMMQAPLPWVGADEQTFTHGMTRLIAAHFLAGIKFQSICELLDIPVADLWKFKHNLDNGKVSLSGRETLMADRQPSAFGVPEADHPVWASLLDGAIELDIRVLSLKLLLTKLRGQMPLISDPEVRQLKARELQHYFERYAPQLAHELGQIRPATLSGDSL
ncbi:hypothetical protein [Denitromonas iodatirespirans]|uniref:Uncharacterized protein n=1 Tax=Denitromonas iodatirespirans TaxID=2795389 RepID=A0A944HAN8_DENI1|nr:hypothetical protein [Denitromonas iodatirespirans]MBT0959576.1 hypothetical protein [Denitromonas iodatirespirans]